jgi:lysozyme family protein
MRMTKSLRAEYEELFTTCQVLPRRRRMVDKVVKQIAATRARYEAIETAIGVPWGLVATIHAMESSRNFNKHLHNGDPLTARTVQVPAGRPRDGQPPFTWEASAEDALQLKKLNRWTDWSVAGMLFKLEVYNGWGYRRYHPEVKSPYLWSFSTHYARGKYVADGTFSNNAVSRQLGGAVILRRLAENGLLSLRSSLRSSADLPRPLVVYAPRDIREETLRLQRYLNTIEGVQLREDGKAGQKTSDAFVLLSGYRLQGDPRT